MKHIVMTACAALACAAAVPAFAHIVVTPSEASAGSYARLAFAVGHGCRGSPTTRIEVIIPDGVLVAKPAPKRGWRLHLTKAKLAVPARSHGQAQTERVERISWSGGPLDDQYYDEFVVLAKLPDATGTVLFPVVQTCEQGRNHWSLPPGKTSDDRSVGPAPAVRLAPAAPPHAH